MTKVEDDSSIFKLNEEIEKVKEDNAHLFKMFTKVVEENTALQIRSRSFDATRARVLLQALVDMMDKQEESPYVSSIFELTAVWDDAECDGYCLYEEAKALLEGYNTLGGYSEKHLD